jgi:hypothetical protein
MWGRASRGKLELQKNGRGVHELRRSNSIRAGVITRSLLLGISIRVSWDESLREKR